MFSCPILFHFFASDKFFHFFVAKEKKEKLEWTSDCEEAFSNLKAFLKSSPILTCPIVDSLIYLYLIIINQTISSLLVQETNKVEWPVNFTSKVFKSAEARYQKIQRLFSKVSITARKLKPYFQGRWVMVKANYLIWRVLKKPDLAKMMVSRRLNYLSTISNIYPNEVSRHKYLLILWHNLAHK